MDSIFETYSLNWLKFIKKYFFQLFFIFIIGLILGFLLDKNFNIKKEGVNFRVNFSVDQNIKNKYLYAYDLIEYLYKINSSVIIQPNRIYDISNALNLVNYESKQEIYNNVNKIFNSENDDSLNIFSSFFINGQERLEFEFEITSNKKINYIAEDVIDFQKNLVFTVNNILFNEFINYYNLYEKNSVLDADEGVNNYDLNIVIKKLNEIQNNLYDQPELLGIYQFMNNYVINELQIQKNKNELSKIINEIGVTGILKLVKITEIKDYTVQLFNIQFKVLLPIIFLIISIMFFLIIDEYFKKSKN